MAIYADLMFLIINRHTGRYDWLMSIVGVWIVSAATKDTFSVGVVVDKDWLLHMANYLLVVR